MQDLAVIRSSFKIYYHFRQVQFFKMNQLYLGKTRTEGRCEYSEANDDVCGAAHSRQVAHFHTSIYTAVNIIKN